MIGWLLGFLLLAYLVQRYMLEHALDGLSYQVQSEQTLVELEEKVEVRVTISNRKKWMLPYLCVREQLPKDCKLWQMSQGRKEEREGLYQQAFLETKLYLAAWQKAEISRTLCFQKRGSFRLFSTVLEAGDFLGLATRSMQVESSQEVVVLPERTEQPQIHRALGGFVGELSVRRFWMEDPMLTAGFREYTGREAFRSISWKQSARNQKLMVKEYDYTAEPSCIVILDISVRNFWEKSLEWETEECFRIARVVCETLEKQGFSYEFRTNAVIMGAMGTVNRVLKGRGRAHLLEILELLGRASSHYKEHLPELLEEIEKERGSASACILISLEEARECKEKIARLHTQSGQAVLLLQPETEKKQEGGEGQ
ncbi:MAG: DUF58 domain-containing protein [bacterium]|nr:DUF58 domain-containing protein [bacterium]